MPRGQASPSLPFILVFSYFPPNPPSLSRKEKIRKKNYEFFWDRWVILQSFILRLYSGLFSVQSVGVGISNFLQNSAISSMNLSLAVRLFFLPIRHEGKPQLYCTWFSHNIDSKGFKALLLLKVSCDKSWKNWMCFPSCSAGDFPLGFHHSWFLSSQFVNLTLMSLGFSCGSSPGLLSLWALSIFIGFVISLFIRGLQICFITSVKSSWWGISGTYP